jgi:hypothetical protein
MGVQRWGAKEGIRMETQWPRQRHEVHRCGAKRRVQKWVAANWSADRWGAGRQVRERSETRVGERRPVRKDSKDGVQLGRLQREGAQRWGVWEARFRSCRFWACRIFSPSILGVAVARLGTWRVGALGGARSEGAVPLFTELDLLLGMGDTKKEPGEIWGEPQGDGDSVTYCDDLQTLPVEGALGHGPVGDRAGAVGDLPGTPSLPRPTS